MLVSLDQGRARRVLIVPAWFDEANKLRRFTIETMRALDEDGVDSFLPDLPGTNESLVPLENQSIASWQSAARDVSEQVGATHVLAIRAGALIAPHDLPGWLYAPQTGPKQLRAMLRARTIASRESGIDESGEGLLEIGRREGLTLAGWRIGHEMLREMETAEPAPNNAHTTIAQKELGGPGLWLRAEPDEDAAQSAALAAIVADDQCGAK
ncbi:hypothetical protein CD351_10765 [Erythrobacter sp. KY5]|nr:hypothetical protein CD351_10765 [Erythrobacter sp. KY5]